jgi:hypothetical protein
MHELSRHVIHISEALKVATRNIGSMVEYFNYYHDADSTSQEDKSPTRQKDREIVNELISMMNRSKNIEDRAEGFIERLKNEIKLVRWLSKTLRCVKRH